MSKSIILGIHIYGSESALSTTFCLELAALKSGRTDNHYMASGNIRIIPKNKMVLWSQDLL